MAREIRLNAFDMNCVGHQSPGRLPDIHPGSGYRDVASAGEASRVRIEPM
jgi:hypothetical protein